MNKQKQTTRLALAASSLAMLIGLFSFFQGFHSYVIHSHHGLGEHAHRVAQVPDLDHGNWRDPKLHLASAHLAHLPHGNFPLEPEEQLPLPQAITVHLPLYLVGKSIEITSEAPFQEADFGGTGEAPSVTTPPFRSRALPLPPRSGAPPPASRIASILLSNHALLL